MDEALALLAERGPSRRRAAHSRLSARRTRSPTFVARARARVRRRAEPRRADAHADGERSRARSGEARSPSCTSAERRSPRASSPTQSSRGSRPPAAPLTLEAVVMTLSRQAEIPSPLDPGQCARLHPARLRRLDVDALRRLRPRFDQRGDHARLFRTRRAAASDRQAQRHRLLVEDADLHARPEPRLQLGARAHALGADRRLSRQPRPHLSRRLRRRRHRLDRPRPVRPRHAARRATWSTSSRTTACTA